MRLNPIFAELGTYPIQEIKDRALAILARGERLIDFSIGDPTEPTPAFIAKALRDAVPAVSQYPSASGTPEQRQAIADYVARRFGVTVDPDVHIVPTSGSKEAIFSTPLAFVDRDAGDIVAYGTPGYPVYERGALFAGARIHPIVLEGDFVLRAGDVPDDVWAQAAMLWLCTPHNPAGAVTSAAELSDLLEAARASDTLLLSDECYTDVYEGAPPASALQVAGEGARGVLVYLSCSKRSGMTGYRSGAIIGDAEAIDALKRLRTTTGTAPTVFVSAAAATAWSDDDHAAERREIFARKRAILRKAFDEVGYETVASQAGLYLWLRVGDDVAVASRLLDGGVVVSPGRAFGPGGEGYIRLALVPTVEECEAAVEVVQQCLSN